MSKKVLPTMSIFGITSDPSVIAEKLFLYFLTSDYSQSVTFYGNISSLKYILNQYATEPNKVKSEVYDTLYNLYRKYFQNVDINIELVKEDKDKPDYTLNFDINVSNNDSEAVTISESVKVSGSNVTNLLDLIYR